MLCELTVSLDPRSHPGGRLVAPLGLPTPYQMPVGFEVSGGNHSLVGETTTGQMAALIVPLGEGRITLTCRFVSGGIGYPEEVFQWRQNRYTQPEPALVAEARAIRDGAGGGAHGLQAIVDMVAGKFRYAMPERRFNEDTDQVPHLSCGLTEGTCIDINTYLVASLRAAGYEAGYVTGYFFPEEKNGTCNDMHCWVVSRHEGVISEWDIAHHMKMGVDRIGSGLNPKPGDRVALAHSMGLDLPEIGVSCTKLLAEPMWLETGGRLTRTKLDIRRIFKQQ